MSKLNLLPNSILFESLRPESTHKLEALATTLNLRDGETLFVQGDDGDALYIVVSGKVEISTMSVGGKKLSLNIMKTDDVFGEIAAIDGGPRTATATTLETTTLRRISRPDIMGLLGREPDVAADLIGVLCERVRWVSQQVEDFGLHGIECRLAHRLLLLDQKFSDGTGQVNLSQNDLADFLGASRESVNKVLQLWVARDFIELSRGSVSILIRDAIEEIATQTD